MMSGVAVGSWVAVTREDEVGGRVGGWGDGVGEAVGAGVVDGLAVRAARVGTGRDSSCCGEARHPPNNPPAVR